MKAPPIILETSAEHGFCGKSECERHGAAQLAGSGLSPWQEL